MNIGTKDRIKDSRERFCKAVGVDIVTDEVGFSELLYEDIIGGHPFLCLSINDRVLLCEWLYMGHTYKEIANKLGTTETSISRKISGILEVIKVALAENRQTPELTIAVLKLDSEYYRLLGHSDCYLLSDLRNRLQNDIPIKYIGPARKRVIEAALLEFDDFVRYMA